MKGLNFSLSETTIIHWKHKYPIVKKTENIITIDIFFRNACVGVSFCEYVAY